MKVVLFKGKSFISRLIRWQTRSEYSHAAVLVEETTAGHPVMGFVIESMEGVGVRAAQWKAAEDADVFEVEGLSELEKTRVLKFLNEQVGKKYDWLMVLRFISRRQESRATSGKWFCSELVFAAFLKAGVELLARTEAWEVSPGLLARSPWLKRVEILKGPQRHRDEKEEKRK